MAGGFTLSALRTRIEVDIQGFRNQMSEAASAGVRAAQEMSQRMSRVANVGQTLSKAGASMTKAFTVPLVGAGVACTKFYLTAENSFAKVNTIIDQTKVSNEELHKQVKEASNETGVAIEDFNEALYSTISAGVDSGSAIQFTTEMTKLAKGGFTSTEQAVNVVTTALNAYGMGADKATAVSDKLITTQNLGKTTVDELAASMGKVIPTANSYGVNIDNVCASLADLTKNGIATAEATTYYNSMLNELGKSGTKVSDVIKEKMGGSFTDLMNQGVPLTDVLKVVKDTAKENGLALGDMFGSAEAAKAALTIMKDDGVEYNEILRQMENSAGATDKAFQTMDQTPLERLKKALNELKNVAIDFGAKMAPAVKVVTDVLEKLGEKFSSLTPEQQEFIIKAGLIVAALGPVLSIVGKTISIVTSLSSVISGVGSAISAAGGVMALLSNPVTIVIGVIGALIAIGIALYKNWDTIKEKLGQLKEWISEKFNEIKEKVSEIFNNIKETISNVFNSIKDTVQNVWETIKNAVSVGVMFIGSILEAAFDIITLPFRFIWENCKEFILEAWESIKESVSGALDKISGIIQSVWEAITGFLGPILEGIKNTVSEIWQSITTTISEKVTAAKNTITNVFNTVKNFISGIWNGIKSTISGAVDGIKNKVSTTFDNIKKAISGPLETVKNTVSNIFGSIKNAIGDKLNGAKDIVKGTIDKIKGFFNFSWSLPKLKMPHFSIKGSFSLNPPSVPHLSIDWYKDGAIMNGATIFGKNGNKLLGGGEAGQEAILPLEGFYDRLSRMLDERIPQMGSSLTVNIERFENNREQDVRAFAQELEFYRRQISRGEGAVT